jgi:hypothetical protein
MCLGLSVEGHDLAHVVNQANQLEPVLFRVLFSNFKGAVQFKILIALLDQAHFLKLSLKIKRDDRRQLL